MRPWILAGAAASALVVSVTFLGLSSSTAVPFAHVLGAVDTSSGASHARRIPGVPRSAHHRRPAARTSSAPVVAAASPVPPAATSSVVASTSATPTTGSASAAAGPASTPSSTTPSPTTAYYVDCVGGSDTGDGSAAQPWRSLAPVRAMTFPANTGIYLARGCTWNETLQVSASGTTSAAGVLVAPYGSGAQPLISGAGLAVSSPVSLLGADVTLDGIAVTAATQYAVQLFGADDAVRNVTVTNSGIGIRAMGAGDVIDRSSASDLHMIVNTPGGDDDYGAVGYDVEASGVTVTNSSCTNCRAPSYDWGYDGGFVEIWNSGDDLVVSNDTAVDTEGFLEVGGNARGTSARHVRILDNTMTEVHGGIFVHNKDNFRLTTQDILVSGNTITNRTPASNPVFGGDLATVEITNNVITADQPLSFEPPGEHSGNTYYLPSIPDPLGFTLGAGEILRSFAPAR